MQTPDTITSFGAMLRRALGDAVAADAGEDFLAMCSDDIVFQLPYAPDGMVTELRGRDALAAYLPKVAALIAFESLSTPTVHPSQDGETFTVEFSCKGHGVKTKNRYDQDYVSIIQVQNGRIIRYRDYWNPLTVLNAVGGADTLSSELGQSDHA